MTQGKIIFKGIDSILKSIAPVLETAEEKRDIGAKARKIINQSGAIDSESVSQIAGTISDSVETVAKAKSLEIDILKKTLGFYQDSGHAQENIQGLFGPQLEKLLEMYEDFTTIKDLIHRGVILKTVVRESIELEDKALPLHRRV